MAQDLNTHDNLKNLESFSNRLKTDNPELHEKIFNPILPYNKLKKNFEKNFFKIMRPLCIAQILDDGNIHEWDWDCFKKAYSNIYRTVEQKVGKKVITKTIEFIPRWLKNSSMRTYDVFCFCPPPARMPPNSFNRYTGMFASKITVESSRNVKPFLDHLKIMTNNVESHCQYLLHYFADMIQNPGRLPNVAIVFKAIEGARKNVLLDFIRLMILGVALSSETADPVNDLFSLYALGRKQKLMVVINEANALETHRYADRIKDMITSHTYNHSEKYINNIVLENFARLLLTSNSDVPYKVIQSDRRFVIFECSSEKVGDLEYFDGLCDYANDLANVRAVYEYLLAVDLTGVHLTKDRPKTEAYLGIQKNTVKAEYKFLEYIVKQRLHERYNDKIIAFKAMDFFCEFTRFLQLTKCQFQITSTKFGANMTNIMKEIKSINKRKSTLKV
jgi:hypothetical protein